jgi:hypothetical protein
VPGDIRVRDGKWLVPLNLLLEDGDHAPRAAQDIAEADRPEDGVRVDVIEA